MQAISESVHVSWDTQLEQNRTRRICRTPRARRNKKSWDTPLFSAQLTAVPSRSLCSVYIHAYTWFASSIKRHSVVIMQSITSEVFHPKVTIYPHSACSLAWLDSAMAWLGLSTYCSRVQCQRSTPCWPCHPRRQGEQRTGCDPIDQNATGHPVTSETTLSYIKHHCRQHETAEFAQFCTRFTLAGTTYVANGARSAQEWCQWRRVPD